MWAQYIHPNGLLYWASFADGIVSDEQPINMTTEIEYQLQRIRNEKDHEQWEVYVSGGLTRFVHHASRSASVPSEDFYTFKARIQQAPSDIMTSSSLSFENSAGC